MQAELIQISQRVGTVETGRYTRANGYMTEVYRPNRTNVGGGIKVFDGDSISDASELGQIDITTSELRDVYRVWRAEDILGAIDVLRENEGRLLVVGSPQSGKGTIIYGISEVCDKQGLGYTMIDGHWLETPAQNVISAIETANANGKIIFFDSFDYLLAGSGKIRKENKVKHGQRTREILAALKATTVPIVLTSHDEYWRETFLDPELISEHQEFLNTLGTYELSRYIESAESRFTFLVDHEYTSEEALRLLDLPDNDLIKDVIATKIGNSDYVDELRLALKDYGVLKKLAREMPDEVKKLLEDLPGNEQAAQDLVYLILSVHFESDFAVTLRWKK